MIQAIVYFLFASIIGVFVFDKSTIETTYYSYGIAPSVPSTLDYIMYYGTRISLILCIYFLCSSIYKSIKREKELEKNTAKVSKIIYKGIVIAKDARSDTYGNSDNIRTSHDYTTSIRVPDINNTVYFYDKYTYMNCMENEAVGVLVTTNLDKNGQALAIKYDFMDSYKQYQDIKDKYIKNLELNFGTDGVVTEVSNIPWNEFIIF